METYFKKILSKINKSDLDNSKRLKLLMLTTTTKVLFESEIKSQVALVSAAREAENNLLAALKLSEGRTTKILDLLNNVLRNLFKGNILGFLLSSLRLFTKSVKWSIRILRLILRLLSWVGRILITNPWLLVVLFGLGTTAAVAMPIVKKKETGVKGDVVYGVDEVVESTQEFAKLSKDTNIKELERSRKAKDLNISNEVTSIEVRNNLAKLTKHIIDPLKKKFGKRLLITSGYRTPELNKRVGGKPNSQHTKGQAVDLQLRGGNVQELFDYIKDNLDFDQLIYETSVNKKTGKETRWVHVSYNEKSTRSKKNKLLVYDSRKGYSEAPTTTVAVRNDNILEYTIPE